MARKEEKNGFNVLTIATPDNRTRASFVPEKGGTGCSLIVPWREEDREVFYLHDSFWDRDSEHIPGGWPFLFPVCARMEREGTKGDYLYEGRIYNLPSHGFGPREAWEAVDTDTDDTLTLRLVDNERTREGYPFRFEVRLTYRVEPGALVCEQTYTNTGDVALPYFAGFHPYLLTPPADGGKEEVMLDYKPIQQYIYNDRMTDFIGVKEPPEMPARVTHPEINEILTKVGADKEAVIRMPDGFIIRLAAEGVEDPDLFSCIQLYTIPEKPFFCVEPWMSFPNAFNTMKGVRWLAPGTSEHGVMRLSTNG